MPKVGFAFLERHFVIYVDAKPEVVKIHFREVQDDSQKYRV